MFSVLVPRTPHRSLFHRYESALAANLGSIQTSAIDPKSGAADFFSQDLTVTIDGKQACLSWVGSGSPLPPELQNILNSLQYMIEALV